MCIHPTQMPQVEGDILLKPKDQPRVRICGLAGWGSGYSRFVMYLTSFRFFCLL